MQTTLLVPIEKGADWGVAGELAPGTAEAASDPEIAELIRAGIRHVRPLAGDMARTLGIAPATLRRPAAMLLPLDAIDVALDGETMVAASHVLVGPRSRPVVAILNAAFVGDLNMAPRAHPGDGRLDIVRFDLNTVDWYKARRRMPTAAHLPHPGISARQAAEWECSFDRATRVELDGSTVRKARSVTCRVRPDAIIAGV